MAEMPAPLPMELQGVRYAPGGRTVLHGISHTLAGEGITLLLGPNGAGKSVLLRLIAGLEAPHGGRISWQGRPVPPAGIAMVFQQPMMLRTSVRHNVAVALKPLRLDRREAQARVAQALERVGLGHRAEESARHLSGGEQQRLALARAWAIRPRLLLLDEPTANLDPTATEAVERIVREIRTEGARVLMTTHNLGQATRLADDILFISDGRLCEHAPAARFFSRPASAEARLFIEGELPWRHAFPNP